MPATQKDKRNILKEYTIKALKLFISISIPILLAFATGIFISISYAQKSLYDSISWLNRISNDLLLALIGALLYYYISVLYHSIKSIIKFCRTKKKYDGLRIIIVVAALIVYTLIIASLICLYSYLSTIILGSCCTNQTSINNGCLLVKTIAAWFIALVACSLINVSIEST